jgi:hypothetical protein
MGHELGFSIIKIRVDKRLVAFKLDIITHKKKEEMLIPSFSVKKYAFEKAILIH